MMAQTALSVVLKGRAHSMAKTQTFAVFSFLLRTNAVYVINRKMTTPMLC